MTPCPTSQQWIVLGQRQQSHFLSGINAATDIISRLLGIGRNQYIELMNKTRTKSKFGGLASSLFRRSYRELLPSRPVSSVSVLPWWVVQVCSDYIHILYYNWLRLCVCPPFFGYHL